MEGKILGGIILLIIGVFLTMVIVISKINELIKTKKFKYKLVKGRVIKSVNTSNKEYLNSRNEEFFKTHKHARKIYDVLRIFLPAGNIDEEKYNGTVYASVIQYEVDNKKYEIVSSFSSDRKEKKGKLYKIRYNSINPKEAFIEDDRGKIIWIILIAISIGFGIKLLLF